MKRPRSLALAPSVVLLLATLGLSGCDANDGHDDHDDHGPPGASSNEVSLSSEQVQAASIKTQVAGPGIITQRLRLTAVVAENLDAQAHLTPKVPGLVRSIRKNLGDRVEVGEILCELESTQLGQATSTFTAARASAKAAREALEQEAALLARAVEIAQTILDREERLKDQEITTLRPYYAAQKALAQANLDRDRRILTLRRELRRREIELHTATEMLGVLGLDAKDQHCDAKGEELCEHGRFPVRAPLAGVIVARDITENEYVDTSGKLFLIQDLSRVWVVASVYERDLRKVERGLAAEIHLQAFPGVTLKGEVTFLDYRVDPISRACKVRVELVNNAIPGWKEQFPLRPGLFGTVELVLAEQPAAVIVPEGAIVHEGEQTFVFVALGEGAGDTHAEAPGPDDDHDDHDDHEAGGDDEATRQRFARRRVEVGATSSDVVEIKSGLEAGERVVVEGTFTLKSAARQSELGGGHSH